MNLKPVQALMKALEEALEHVLLVILVSSVYHNKRWFVNHLFPAASPPGIEALTSHIVRF